MTGQTGSSLAARLARQTFLWTGGSVMALLLFALLLSRLWLPAAHTLPLWTIVLAVIVLSLLIASSIAWRVSHSGRLLTADLQRVIETQPLLVARRYQHAGEHIDSHPAQLPYPELNRLRLSVAELARAMMDIEERAATRIRECYERVDTTTRHLEHIRRLINAAQMFIMTVDDKLEIQFFNQHAQDITGIAANDIVNTGAAHLFSSAQWEETAFYYREILAGNIRMAHQESELIDHDGNIRTIWWLHSMLDDPESRLLLSVGHDITEEKSAEKRLVWLSSHDALTSLLNKPKFLEELESSLSGAIRYSRSNALLQLHLDFDHFRKLDPALTRERVDEMQLRIAESLRAATRYTDTLGRLGEQDFAVIQPDSENGSREGLVNKIIERIDTLDLRTPKKNLPIPVHVGVIEFPFEDAGVSELLAFAELATVRARHAHPKASGFHVFSPDEETVAQLNERVYWKQRISQALDENLFTLHFQPILDLANNEIGGFEVLLRLQDTETGEMLTAQTFIDIAEKQELITQIDLFVLQQCFQKLHTLQQQQAALPLSINLSSASMDPHTLLPVLKRLFKRYPIDPALLVFELSEAFAVADIDKARLIMTAVRQLGCRFALDNFGVDSTVSKYGFSSFVLLQSLPLDLVKISGSFIKELHSNNHDQLFVKTLIDEARIHGVKTVAEHVESEEALALLQEYGADYVQGYLIGRPAPLPSAQQPA